MASGFLRWAYFELARRGYVCRFAFALRPESFPVEWIRTGRELKAAAALAQISPGQGD